MDLTAAALRMRGFVRAKTPSIKIRNSNVEIRNKDLNPNFKIRNELFHISDV